MRKWITKTLQQWICILVAILAVACMFLGTGLPLSALIFPSSMVTVVGLIWTFLLYHWRAILE